MIEIRRKSKCCGCGVCVQRCPKQCITMREDEEGFLYPKVDVTECVDCGLCEKVCPVLNQDEERRPQLVLAAKNRNEQQRLESSSGGIFVLLAERIIEQDGVVFGARFDGNWDVEHGYAETFDELSPLMRSKYVQSRIGNTYKEAEMFLKKGRKVLFTGTPCQIAGLCKFLQRDFENLLTVDIICHGVPSPAVWHRYLKETSTTDITGINFREKNGFSWKSYGFSIDTVKGRESKPSWETSYMVGFWNDVYLRPSCAKCPAKSGKSGADITLGDLWGIENIVPEMDDNRGTSVVLGNTDKGIQLLSQIVVDKKEIDYDVTVSYNPCLIKSSTHHPNRHKFFKMLNEGDNSLQDLLSDAYKLNVFQKIFVNIRAVCKNIAKTCN